MSFATPFALLLLLALPLIVWLVWPRRAGGRPRSGWLGLVLRLLIVTLIVLSLAGAQLVRAVDDLAVIFLVDASDSMDREASAAAEQFVRDAVAQMGPDDRAGIILFGANALVEQPLQSFSAAGDLPLFASRPLRLHTNLAGAVRLALALLPADAARRIVVLSDGAATMGDTAEAARLAAATGATIDTVYLPRVAAGSEMLLRDVRAPTRVGQGESFRLEVAAESTAAATATLRVLGDGAVVYEEVVELSPGVNRFVVGLRAGEPAFARYRVQLSPADPAADTFPQNNELAAFTEITGQPRVLIVAAPDGAGLGPAPTTDAPLDEATQLADALAASGLLVDRTTPVALSPDLADLGDYAGIVLVNVNARDLSQRRMAALQSYVRDLGGGLTAVGGPDSFGMGGYFGTPLEETLPVDMQIDDEERFPSVSLALVIDRSGSMAAEENGVAKIQLAAEGAARALELLHANDEMTLIPVDEAADDIIGPVTADNREAAVARMRALGAGGGGIFVRTGLEAAAEALAGSDSEIKHIIVLADGADAEQQEGVPELIDELAAQGITVSMVSIGQGPDTPWLRAMAERGGGRFHLTDEAANLPQIFTQETAAIQRSYLVEERFFPAQVNPSPILTGIVETPALYGYVAAEPKATAQVVLATHLDDPLLATWQYGLGRAAAWTSDATGRWGRDWVRWNGFAPFWNQAVRWTFGGGAQGGLTATVRLDGDRARLAVDARDETGAYLNDLELSAAVVAPAGETETVALQLVAPGRYEGAFTPAAEGAYFIGIGTTDDGQQTIEDPSGCGPSSVACGLRTTTGWVLGYSPEYAALESDPALLASLRAATGGRALETATPAAVFDHNLDAAPAAHPIWPWLTLAAALLLPLDVAARRLTLTRRDWARAWERIRNYELGNRNEEQPERAEGMAALLRAKERATRGQAARAESASSDAGERGSEDAQEPEGRGGATDDERRAARVASVPPDADAQPPLPIGEPPSDEPLAARLRKRRNK